MQELKVENQVRFVAPQAHHILSTYYRAADVVLVPSRSESFGLVALEAAACGTPVVANAVGGLLTIVEHGRTGFLVPDRQPEIFARHIANILDDPALSARMSHDAAERAKGYTWSFAAARLRRAYTDITSRDRVVCE
jgi:D-inositol-3-phosphate glycosyltransferase